MFSKRMVFKKRVLFLVVTLLVFYPFSSPRGALAELPPDGNEIVKRVDRLMVGDSAEYDSVMLIKRPNLEDVEVRYKTYFKGRGKKVFVNLLYPPEQAGKNLLLVNNNIWQYVPNVGKAVRVAGSQRFMGGEFNNADLVKISFVDDYEATLVGIREVDGERCYFLKLKAKRPDVTYEEINYWVRVDNLLPLQEEYVTSSGKKLKTLIFSDVGPLGTLVRPRRLTMVSALRPEHQTMVFLSNAIYDKHIPNYLFSRAYLEAKKM